MTTDSRADRWCDAIDRVLTPGRWIALLVAANALLIGVLVYLTLTHSPAPYSHRVLATATAPIAAAAQVCGPSISDLAPYVPPLQGWLALGVGVAIGAVAGPLWRASR